MEETLQPLFTKRTTIFIPGTKEFVLTKDVLERTNIDWKEGHFQKSFLGKRERDIPDSVIAAYGINQSVSNLDIIDRLESSQMYIYQLVWLIENQPKDQAGPLLINGVANVGFIADKGSNPWNVYFRLRDDCGHAFPIWHIRTQPLINAENWSANHQVVAPNF